MQWKQSELAEVLAKGEQALNVVIEPGLRQQMIDDANQNVGLLQRIAERFCWFSDVLETTTATMAHTLGSEQALQKARESICNEEGVRYKQFGHALMHGFKASEESELKVYMHIARCVVEATDQELKGGMHYDLIFDRISHMNNRIRRSDLTAALQRLNRLQQDRRVSPLVISYNDATKELQLIDRELLFYRRYGTPMWPWSSEAADSDPGELSADEDPPALPLDYESPF